LFALLISLLFNDAKIGTLSELSNFFTVPFLLLEIFYKQNAVVMLPFYKDPKPLHKGKTPVKKVFCQCKDCRFIRPAI
jgi:hypothetical protein